MAESADQILLMRLQEMSEISRGLVRFLVVCYIIAEFDGVGTMM